jgi:hypothetical protein
LFLSESILFSCVSLFLLLRSHMCIWTWRSCLWVGDTHSYRRSEGVVGWFDTVQFGRHVPVYILHEIRKRKANWIGHILRRNCFLKQVIEGKIKGRIEVTRRRGRRRKKLLDDLRDRRGYFYLKEEALDRFKWRNRFGSGCGPVVWQITDDDGGTPILKCLQRNQMWLDSGAFKFMWPVGLFYLTDNEHAVLLMSGIWGRISEAAVIPSPVIPVFLFRLVLSKWDFRTTEFLHLQFLLWRFLSHLSLNCD